MARINMVTRTITSSTISVLCMDIDKSEVVKATYILSGAKENNAITLKELQKKHDTDNYKVVAIQDIAISTALYGMTEDKFLRNADLLPDRK